MIEEYERANIDDKQKVVIADYLKTLQPIFQTDKAKSAYDEMMKLLLQRSPEEVRWKSGIVNSFGCVSCTFMLLG